MHVCSDPDFSNLLSVLRREVPSRPTLFEFFLNGPLYVKLAGEDQDPAWGTIDADRMVARAFMRAGYDYVTLHASAMGFPTSAVNHLASRSMNDTAIITDRPSHEAYSWPDPDSFDYSKLDTIGRDLPQGMKIIVCGPGGVLENVMQLAGYEGLCMMMVDDPELVQIIFDEVGSRLVRYYEISAPNDHVGAVISNDDWGFNTQPMLSPADMRKYVFPWHERIVEAIHAAGKPAILHSCGNLEDLTGDIIDGMRYDGKHSYEDKICPVEDAYERWGGRIAIMGGIDLDFVCRSTPDGIRARSQAMLDRASKRGGFALGSGNSIPYYVPDGNYLAMIEPAVAGRR
jgi:uroporphyrinogen decarboxylase